MKRLNKKSATVLVAFAVVSTLPFGARSISNETYIIEECLDYSECSSKSQNRSQKTETLRGMMDLYGWSGWRYVDSAAWPQDLRESTLNVNWTDDQYGDNRRVAIFSGHGFTHCEGIQFGKRHDGECNVNFPSQTRMGALGGGEAALVIMITCCVGHQNHLMNNWYQGAQKQVLAHHNVSSTSSNMPSDFFWCTNGHSNKQCWLYWATGNGNSPMVFTRGNSPSDVYSNHNYMEMFTGNHMEMPSGPMFYTAWDLVDDGDDGCSP